MIAVVDYGVGNLSSLCCSLRAVGADCTVTGDADVLRAADKIILPGVGAFEDAAKKLKAAGLDRVLKEEAAKNKPILGICLGMQLLFDRSLEYGEHEGLGLIPGEVRAIDEMIPKELKIPHMGWNGLNFAGKQHPLFAGLAEGDCVYFVHSYAAVTEEKYVLATAEYGADLTAAAACGSVCGCQFHPEKSGSVGLRILKNFCEEGGAC